MLCTSRFPAGDVCLDGGGRLNPLTKDDAHAISAIAKDQPATTKTGIF